MRELGSHWQQVRFRLETILVSHKFHLHESSVWSCIAVDNSIVLVEKETSKITSCYWIYENISLITNVTILTYGAWNSFFPEWHTYSPWSNIAFLLDFVGLPLGTTPNKIIHLQFKNTEGEIRLTAIYFPFKTYFRHYANNTSKRTSLVLNTTNPLSPSEKNIAEDTHEYCPALLIAPVPSPGEPDWEMMMPFPVSTSKLYLPSSSRIRSSLRMGASLSLELGAARATEARMARITCSKINMHLKKLFYGNFAVRF